MNLEKLNLEELSQNEKTVVDGGDIGTLALVGACAGLIGIGYYTGKALYYATH